MKNKADCFEKVFLEEEIEQLKNELLRLPAKENSGSEFFAYTNGFVKSDFIFPYIKKVVLDKIEKLIDEKINLTHGFLLKEERPWLIHSDYKKHDAVPKHAFLIPLIPANTHTVIFNQECLTTFSEFIETNVKITNNAKNLYHTYCSHETESNLEYVSLYAVYKWKIGSVIAWDRKLLHCSDNFLVNGVKEKTALVIFTNNDKQAEN